MRTSKQWWDSIKNDPEKVKNWLIRQYIGEVTAVGRIQTLILDKLGEGLVKEVIKAIIRQENNHAEWILGLLKARGIDSVEIENPESRYWSKTLPKAVDLTHTMGIAAHAENMRLERIKVIAEDPDSPLDVRDVFARILPDENFHAKIFRHLTPDNVFDSLKDAQKEGEKVLGLVT